MHTFTPTDVSAFLFKMCKMRRFLHFVNFASADVGYIYIYIYVDLDWKVALTRFSPYAMGQETQD